MFAPVMILLSFALLVMLFLVVLAFLDVAFTGPRSRSTGNGELVDRGWQPPLIHDDELLRWAAAAARTEVRRHLQHRRDATTAATSPGAFAPARPERSTACLADPNANPNTNVQVAAIS